MQKSEKIIFFLAILSTKKLLYIILYIYIILFGIFFFLHLMKCKGKSKHSTNVFDVDTPGPDQEKIQEVPQ